MIKKIKKIQMLAAISTQKSLHSRLINAPLTPTKKKQKQKNAPSAFSYKTRAKSSCKQKRSMKSFFKQFNNCNHLYSIKEGLKTAED